jgi:hypothetical protein
MMQLTSSLALLLTSLARSTLADIIGRSICTFTSPTSSYIGYASMFSYLSTSSSLLQSPPSNINNTFIIPDYCGLSPSYSQNLTYLRAYEVNKDGHEFVYHHELFGLDQYEVDDSGRRNVPVSEAKEVDDVEGHCDGICSELDSMRRMKSQCKGKACKAQVRRG